MADPTPPVAPAKFTHPDDVVARYVEGTFPADKTTWAQLRIEDVESDLIGLVPSLGTTPVGEIDPARLRRVKTLVVDKVLELYRNPDRKTSKSSTMDGFSEVSGYSQNRNGDRPAISFSQEELDRVRVKVKRSKFGTIPVGPPRYMPC